MLIPESCRIVQTSGTGRDWLRNEDGFQGSCSASAVSRVHNFRNKSILQEQIHLNFETYKDPMHVAAIHVLINYLSIY